MKRGRITILKLLGFPLAVLSLVLSPFILVSLWPVTLFVMWKASNSPKKEVSGCCSSLLVLTLLIGVFQLVSGLLSLEAGRSLDCFEKNSFFYWAVLTLIGLWFFWSHIYDTFMGLK